MQISQLSTFAILWLAATAGATEDDWPQWRGPARDGHIAELKLPNKWPAQLTRSWQVDVGLGHSSPLLAGGNVFVFVRSGEREAAGCFDAVSGKRRWSFGYDAPYEVNPAAFAHGPGPKSTPALADGRLYTLGISGIWTCWDAVSGRQLWQRSFGKQYPSTSPLYGTATSPLVDGDRCIAFVGGHDRGALLALDRKTGATVWTWDGDGPGYTSPVVAQFGGTRQIVTQSQAACVSVDASSGKLLWRIPFQTDFDQNSVTPVVYEDSVIFSGFNKGVARYRVEQHDGKWKTDKLWENKEVSMYMSSPVIVGSQLFGFSQRRVGQFFALDLTSGKTLWTSEGRVGENAALLRSGQVIWALTTRADLVAFAVSDKKYQPLANYKVADTPTWAHPVISDAGIFVKDESKLTRWTLPAE